jgi:hypothetical protein
MTKFAYALGLSILLASSASIAKKKVFTDNQCTKETKYRTGKKACKSGSYAGKTIYECKLKRNRKFGDSTAHWRTHKTFTCSADKSKKGVYVNGCDGKNTGYTSLKKACGDSAYTGKTLYRCKYGKQKEKRECEGRRGDSKDDKKHAIFENTCRGKHISDKRSLSKVCKSNSGKLLVRCKNKCVKRKGFKCTKRAWTQVKSMTCSSSGGSKIQIKHCTPSEQATLVGDFKKARTQISALESTVEESLKKSHSKRTTKRLKKALKKIGKVEKRLKGTIKVSCRDEKGICKTRTGAHTFPLIGRGFKVCRSWFDMGADDRAAVIIHELMHKTGCSDKQYWDKSSNPPTDSYRWHNIASTYDYWITEGFCVPGEDC